MRTSFKILTAIMGLGLVILLCLHLFLQYGLTQTMRNVVLPRIKAETGVDVRVGRLSINLPRGLLYLNDVAVRNPDGFLLENLASIDRIQLEVEIASLLKQQPVVVKHIEVEAALLNVIRNKDGAINLHQLQMLGSTPSGTPVPAEYPVQEHTPSSVENRGAEQPKADRPVPEMLIRGLSGNARVRYLDFKLDELEIVLDLGVIGSNLSTLLDPDAPWSDIAVIGSLGDNRTRFVTDLKIRLAPLCEPATPSFDLSGKVMEIDPRIIEEAYSKLGIRSAPFGLEPELHCRKGQFKDSSVALSLHSIEMEDKLAKHLGGTASIGSLRFTVPVEGTLREPVVDIRSALQSAIGVNVQPLLDAFLKGAAAKEAGLDSPPETLTDAVVEVLGTHVDEIGQSEAAKQALKNLVGGESAVTNGVSPVSSDVLVEILGEQVEEIGESEDVKDELKSLGKWLFGK